jgi:hypothetical protein
MRGFTHGYKADSSSTARVRQTDRRTLRKEALGTTTWTFIHTGVTMGAGSVGSDPNHTLVSFQFKEKFKFNKIMKYIEY